MCFPMQSTLTLDEAVQRAWDVIVVGAGPAGSLCATQLARKGARVLLVEARAFPRSKVCGGCLNEKSLAALSAAGLRGAIDRLGPVPLERFQMGAGGRQVSLRLPGGVAVSRWSMDAALAEAAVEAGGALLLETTAIIGDVAGDMRQVELSSHGRTESVGGRIVVAASGLGGKSVSRVEGMRSVESAGSRIGVEATVAEFPLEYEPGVIFMAVGRRGYVGLTRVEDGRLNIAAAVDADALKQSGGPDRACLQILEEAGFPVASEMARADWQGTIRLTRRTPSRGAERLFLIGDAAGYIEPFTGEGMAWALTSGMGVTPLVEQGLCGWSQNLTADWERRYHSIIEKRQWVCRALAAGLRRTVLVRAAVPILSAMPWLARPVIRSLNRSHALPLS